MKTCSLSGAWCLVFGISVAWLFTSCSRSQSSPSDKGPRSAPAIPVTVAVAQQRDVPVQLKAIGNVHAYSTVSIKAQVDGPLVTVGFKEGDAVKQGDLLFTIDPRPYESAKRRAEADLVRDGASLENAVADMRRSDELANTKAVAATLVDQNRAKVAALRGTVAADESALETAKLMLSHCFIKSPIDGRIGVLMVNIGNLVKNNETVLAIVNQLKPTFVDFSVPEQNLGAIRDEMAGDPLTVDASMASQPGRRTQGELKLVNNQVDVATGTVMLRAECANKDEWLWPGQFVDVALTMSVLKNAVIVPAEAVQFSQQGRYVLVVQPDQTVTIEPVEIGESLGREVVVSKGLKAGQQVVTSGQLRLLQGSKVEVKKEQ